MAVKLQTARNTFLAAVQEFPRWMSIRKRPEKATSGLFLQAIVEEQTDIVQELEKFIKEFFLISYMGKESQVADYVYIVQVGQIDYLTSEMIKPVLDITIDAKTFLDNMDIYALYQDGYFIISSSNLPSDGKLLYTYNDYKYGGKLQRYHIWNIFDEFAMFLGLERFSDTGETNKQLLNRCLLVFTNPTNSTRTGLQNVVMNCLSNEFDIEREEVKIEIPDDSNMWLPYNDDTVYEYFVQNNKDIFRTKIWDTTWWEHNFKYLDYLSHIWDKAVNIYQDGTGQLQDLQVTLSDNKNDSTKVTVRGFKKDKFTVNEYFRKQNIRQNIPLQLLRYHDVLNPKRIQYQVTATPAMQIYPENILLKEQVRTEGYNLLYLQDIISNAGYADVVNPGLLKKDKQYELVFKSADTYSDMRINKIDLIDGNTVSSLLSENRIFKLNGTSLVHNDVKHHITKVSELKSFSNLTDTLDGFTLGNVNNTAVFSFDVTGCGGKTLKISSHGDLFDLTEQTDRWECNGLKLQDHKLISDTVIADKGTAILDISCMAFSVNLLRNTSAQGSVDIKVYVNDIINPSLSKLMTEPDSPIEYQFDVLSQIKIVFTKSGSYPFEVEVKGTKYELTYSLSVGKVIQGPASNYISDVPANVQNTLTVTVKSYDVKSPVIRYVHVGPSTSRTSYTVKDIKPVNDNVYLDIDTNCKVYLYEVSEGKKTLISDNFITKRIYRNTSDEDIFLEINIQQFNQILSSSKTIYKTARYGKTVSYITLKPDEEISSIVINGIINHDRALRTLFELLNLDTDKNVYVTKGADGFIVRNTTTGEECLTRINRTSLTEATVFSYEQLPEGISGVFVTDRPNDSRLFSNTSTVNFDDTYLTINEAQQYIAYYETDMYKSEIGKIENIELVSSMFYPSLPSNTMMFYVISAIESNDASTTIAVFKKLWNGNSNYYGIDIKTKRMLENLLTLLEGDYIRAQIEVKLADINSSSELSLTFSDNLYNEIKDLLSQGSWSLGRKEIFIATDFDFNNIDIFSVNVTNTNSVFTLSSEIPVSRYLEANNENIDLCTAVIVPPSYMKVIFDQEDDIIENGLIVKDDGFNKLQYCNIKDISAVIVDGISYSDFVLKKDEGIIVWNKINDIAGKYFSVAYTYSVPTALLYTNLSYLYEITGYDINALLPVNLKTKLKDSYRDKDMFTIEWEEDVDYVPVPVCSNPNFIASYNQGTITVRQLLYDNTALIRAGYYYDNDKEYYMYNHEHVETAERYNNVKLHNVKKLDTIFQLMTESVNYIIHSDFLNGINYEKLCYVNFTDPFIETKGISAFNEITACDTFNMWRSYNMDIQFVMGLKDIGLLFSEEDNTGYAVIDITKYVIPNMLISVFTTEGITLEIYKEIKAEDDSMVKTVFAEPFDVFVTANNFQGYSVPEDIDLSYRYFLVVRGTGILDDMISRQDVLIDDQFKLHVKNLENFGFNVEEKEEAGTLLNLAFEKNGCILDKLEIAKDNTIQIGTNVDYGVTMIFDSSKSYDNFTVAETVIRKKGTFISTDIKGWIKTPFFYVENSANAVDVYIKINNLISGAMKNFNVKLRTADNDLNINKVELGYTQKTNLAHFDGTKINSYLQAEIEMDSGKIIDSVEIFVRYGEKDIEPLRIYNNFNGSVTTKVYDAVVSGSYRLHSIIGTLTDKEHIRIFMRGCKQDKLYMVWTDWYEMIIDNSLHTIMTPHIFDDYRLFQFRIDFLNSNASALIENFVLEVI